MLDFPLEFPRIRIEESEWSFFFSPLLYSEPEPHPLEVRRLNQLAIAIVKYNEPGFGRRLAHRMAHRQLGMALLAELFLLPQPEKFSFEFDEESAEGAAQPLHRIYFIRPIVGQIAYFAYLRECQELSGHELQLLEQALPKLHDSLFPPRLLH